MEVVSLPGPRAQSGGSGVTFDRVFGFARVWIDRLWGCGAAGLRLFRRPRSGSDGNLLDLDGLMIGDLLVVWPARRDGVEKQLGIGAVEGRFGRLLNRQSLGFGVGGLPSVDEDIAEGEGIEEIARFKGDRFSTVGEE